MYKQAVLGGSGGRGGEGRQSSFRLPNTAAGTLCCSSRTSGEEAGRTCWISGRGAPGPPDPLARQTPYHWAPGPSRPRPRPRPARSRPGWPAVPAQPAPPGKRRSWWGGLSAGPGTPATPTPEEELAPPPPASPHKQDLALGPRGLVPLSLGRQLLSPLFQQLHVIHAALARSKVRHWWGVRGSDAHLRHTDPSTHLTLGANRHPPLVPSLPLVPRLGMGTQRWVPRLLTQGTAGQGQPPAAHRCPWCCPTP